jgi:hypothetical protein
MVSRLIRQNKLSLEQNSAQQACEDKTTAAAFPPLFKDASALFASHKP